MSDPFIGEVQIFGFSFAPRSWSFADGSVVAIRQFSTLYALYGTLFGGDGTSTFALPNLVVRGACGAGQSPGNSQRPLGQTFGAAGIALTQAQMPPHTHVLNDYQPLGPTLAATPVATAAIGYATVIDAFAAPGAVVTMDPNAIGASGSGAPHENRQPFLGLNYCVALAGTFPYFS